MNDSEITNIMNSVWKERVYLETAEYAIVGYIFQPKIGKKSRMLTEILNNNKQFLAIKDCRLERKLKPNTEAEYYDFLQINRSSILLMRPANE